LDRQLQLARIGSHSDLYGNDVNPIFKATYQRLLEAGEPKKVAIIACVKKMVVILNSMRRDGTRWDENMAKN
jgi:transposase